MLPIYEIERDIVDRLRANRRLILQAPTGSGKSTQVPQILLKHGFLEQGQAVVLQPRRLAARLLAARVASELKCELGREVGYQIRFDNVTSASTKVKFVTEGILLRQMIQDPKLAGVQALIFDEFHERHLYGDISLARALELQETARPDLAVIVMSATLGMPALKEYLQPCSVLATEGRTFPVEVSYSGGWSNTARNAVWEMAAGAFSDYIKSGGEGDALIFMPGSYEIQRTLESLRQCPEASGFLLLPLHGELPPREQDAAVARHQRPKVVVATNVAETSLTIDGILLVIDSGLARVPRYDANRGVNTLLIEKISRAAAEQRAGRAGRTAPGRCIRLWSQEEHYARPAQELPEVKRLDLSEVVLTLKSAGVGDLRRFRWLEPPGEQSLRHAETLLTDLGALDQQGHITEVGRKMLAFPLHPRYARMLLAAFDYGCVYEACLIAALTQGRGLLLRNAGKDAETFREELAGHQTSSDFRLLMRAWDFAAQNDYRAEACRRAGLNALAARQVASLRDQFLRIAQKEGMRGAIPVGAPREPTKGNTSSPQPSPPSNGGEGELLSAVQRLDPRMSSRQSRHHAAVEKCILIGFSDRVARRLDETSLRCELVHSRRGVLAKESMVQKSPLIVVAEVEEVEGRENSVNTRLSLATAIEPKWLRELFPQDILTRPKVFYDPATKRVWAEEEISFRGLVFSSRRVEPPPQDAAARLLAGEVAQGRLELNRWDNTVEQWILRLNLLGRWCPELQVPAIREADRRDLIEQICLGAFSHKEIKDREVLPVIKSWVSDEQQQWVEKHAPERLTLPNGRSFRLTYVTDGLPFIAARIQELYDVAVTPKIAMNRVPVLLHILAPSRRPVQITQDLAGFWREHYPALKQQLQRRYPRHEWR